MSSVIIKIAGKADQYVTELDKVKAKTKQLEAGLNKIAKISGVAFVALTGTIALTVKQFATFDNQLRGVKTLLDENSFGAKGLNKGFAQMQKEILGVAATFPVGIEGLNKALFDTVSAGVDANQAVETVAIAAKLATAGITDVSIATDGLTSALNAYGLSADEANNVASKFFTAQKFGKTTVEEMSQGFGLVASTAKEMGVSLNELLGSVSALTAGGIRTKSAYAGVRQVLANIAKPTEDAAKEAKRLGVQFDASALRAKGLKGFLDSLTESTNFNKDSVIKLFGSVEAQAAAFAITGSQAGKFTEILKELNDETKTAATFQKAFEVQNASLENKLKRLGNQLQRAAILIGSKFEPMISAATEALTSLFDTFDKNPEVAEFAAFALAAGAALTGLITALALGAKAFLIFRGAMIASRVVMGGLSLSMRVLIGSTGIGLLLLVIGDLAVNWRTRWIQMQSIFVAFVKNIKPLLFGIGDVLIGVFTGDLAAIKQGWTQIQGAFGQAMDDFSEVMVEKETELADKRSETQTEQATIQLEKALELEQTKFNSMQTLKTQHKDEEAIAEATALDQSEVLERESFIRRLKNFQEFRGQKMGSLGVMDSTELAQLGKQIKTKEDVAIEHTKETLKIEIDRHNKFLADEREFGTSFATINRVMSSKAVSIANESSSQLVGLARSKNSTLAAIGKAAALTQIGIDTARGAIAAYASLAPIPFVGPALGIAAAAAVVAFGVEQAGQVLAANKGGTVPNLAGARAGVDSQPALLTPGEVVTPAQSYDELINAVASSRLRESAITSNRLGGQQASAVNSVQGAPQAVRVLIDMSEEASRNFTADQVRDQQMGTSTELSGEG